jgi:hypothetical protein
VSIRSGGGWGGGSTSAAPWRGGGLCGLRGRSRRPLNSRGAVLRHRVEARKAFISSVRRAGTAHCGDRRSDGGLSGRQTLRTAGTRCEDRGRTSRGLWGARSIEKERPSLGAQPGSRGARGADAAQARRTTSWHGAAPSSRFNSLCPGSDAFISKLLN